MITMLIVVYLNGTTKIISHFDTNKYCNKVKKHFVYVKNNSNLKNKVKEITCKTVTIK